MIANNNNTGVYFDIDNELGPDGSDWDSQDGSSIDIIGTCKNIQVYNVSGPSLQINELYTDTWECRDFSESLRDDVSAISFEYGGQDVITNRENNNICQVKLNYGDCGNKGPQSSIMEATTATGSVSFDIDNEEGPDGSAWDSQDGDSIDIKGECSNIIVTDVDSPPLIIGENHTTHWNCVNFGGDLPGDVSRVMFEAYPLSEPTTSGGNEAPPPTPKQCEVILVNDDCGEGGAQSNIISSDGTYNIDSDGLKHIMGNHWGDQDGESIMFKGDCKYIRVNDVDNPNATTVKGEEDDPLIIRDKHNTNWECINMSTVAGNDLWDDVGNVTIQTGL